MLEFKFLDLAPRIGVEALAGSCPAKASTPAWGGKNLHSDIHSNLTGTQ